MGFSSCTAFIWSLPFVRACSIIFSQRSFCILHLPPIFVLFNSSSTFTCIRASSMDNTANRRLSELSNDRLSGRYKGEVVKDDQDVQEISQPGDKIVYPNALKASIIVAGLFLASFLVALDQTIISTAIPKITDQFKSVTDVGWYGSAYFLTSTGLQPTFGRIYKIFNVGGTNE